MAMAQLMQAHRLSELRLSMSGGHWEEGWGGAALVPPGVALWISTPRVWALLHGAHIGTSRYTSIPDIYRNQEAL